VLVVQENWWGLLVPSRNRIHAIRRDAVARLATDLRAAVAAREKEHALRLVDEIERTCARPFCR
jgi:hypothetical protein